MADVVKKAVYISFKHEVGTGKTVVNGRKLDKAADDGGGVLITAELDGVTLAVEAGIFPGNVLGIDAARASSVVCVKSCATARRGNEKSGVPP